jgi:NAD(P)H-hydrate epimerase
MSRLSGLPLETILSDTAGTAASFAGQKDVVCILKDHNTVTTDGNLTYINTTGNSGMATGGSGDVLSGIIAGILAQRKNGRLTLLEAAALGVYIHGLAGDAAAAELGEYSMMASDIISRLPRVLKNF